MYRKAAVALVTALLALGLAAPASAAPITRPLPAPIGHHLLACWGVLSAGQLHIAGPERIDAIRYSLRFKGGKIGSKPSYSIVRTWC